jgi:glycosyltransferase involved in cell wall biosynthesis
MNNNPLVSIIVPTYNRSNIIERAIQSVINQAYTNWEIIIVDDGSTDNTKKTIRKYLKDKRITYHYTPHRGVCHARNYGMKKSKGEYISLLDSDDEYLENRLAYQLECMKKSNADFSLSDRLICINGRVKKNNAMNSNKRKFFLIKGYKHFTAGLPLSASFMMFKRKIIKDVEFDIHLPSGNDFDFILRIFSKYTVFFINKQLNINYKTYTYDRISTQYDKKIQGCKLIYKKLKNGGSYQLDKIEQELLEKNILKMLGLFNLLEKQYEMGRNYLKEYFNLEKTFSLEYHKIKLIYLISFYPFLFNWFTKILKSFWNRGLIELKSV